jgi:hypothetical protein
MVQIQQEVFPKKYPANSRPFPHPSRARFINDTALKS